ncbi:DNA-binding response regulator [bacterium]|nr:MAG: DNA-binding response regulator [bacterium]
MKAKSQISPNDSPTLSTATGARPIAFEPGETLFTTDHAIRVLCVDDHALLVEGLKAQFAIEGNFQVVGWLSDAEKLLEEVARLSPDFVLLDIEMPGPDSFEMAARLRHARPGQRIVFLSAHIRDGYLASAYKCGAWGYFAKGDELTDIVAGLKDIATSRVGTFVMGPKVRERCALAAPGHAKTKPASATPLTPLHILSAREVEVLRLIGKGLSRVEIAKELSRSVKTIDGHQDRLMKKLSLQTRADLIRFAIREGFAEA